MSTIYKNISTKISTMQKIRCNSDHWMKQTIEKVKLMKIIVVHGFFSRLD